MVDAISRKGRTSFDEQLTDRRFLQTVVKHYFYYNPYVKVSTALKSIEKRILKIIATGR
jgi:hypothetical protein